MTFTVSTAGYLSRYGPSAPVYVHGWIDWNGDGDWSDSGELVLAWSGYPGCPSCGWAPAAISTTVTVSITAPVSLAPLMWSRFRLDYNQNLASVIGPARYGEVEDYPLLPAFRLFLPLVSR